MFTESLNISLSLTLDSTTYNIPKGAIKETNLDISSSGFRGSINFIRTTEKKESKFFTQFIKPGLIEFEVSIHGVFNQPAPPPEALKVKGLVTGKSVKESTFEGVSTKPIMYYDYNIDIMDAPQVLWKQHFPIKLYTQKKMSEVIRDNSVKGVSPEMDWEELEKKHDHVCLALGNDKGKASFYDFIMWYTQSRGGICFFDYIKQDLKITDKKQANIPDTILDRHDVEDYHLLIPEILRNNIRIHNSSAELHNTLYLEQDEAVEGISHDRITRTDISNDMEVLKNRQKKNLDIPLSEVDIVFKQFPPKTFFSGSMVKFSKEKWLKNISFNKKTFRVIKIDFHATAINRITESGINAEYAEFNIDMTARMEEKDNPARIFPEFKAPQYPLPVEGKIISEIGNDPDKTYQIYTHEETSLRYFYEENLPVFLIKRTSQKDTELIRMNELSIVIQTKEEE